MTDNRTTEFVECGVCKFYHADIQLCEYGIPPCSKFERKAMTSATDNRTTELLPCPFCGGEAHIAENVGYRGDIAYTVNCNDVHGCIASDSGFWYSSREAAIEAWNTRHVETCHSIDSIDSGEFFICSNCNFGAGRVEFIPNYCPNCGCKVVGA